MWSHVTVLCIALRLSFTLAERRTRCVPVQAFPGRHRGDLGHGRGRVVGATLAEALPRKAVCLHRSHVPRRYAAAQGTCDTLSQRSLVLEQVTRDKCGYTGWHGFTHAHLVKLVPLACTRRSGSDSRSSSRHTVCCSCARVQEVQHRQARPCPPLHFLPPMRPEARPPLPLVRVASSSAVVVEGGWRVMA